MSETKATVAIMGGGPAGLFAAERLAEAGVAVTIYDRMPSMARKFLMAGRGGLNLTHSEPMPRFLAHYDAAEPVRGAVERFPPSALIAWCEGLGEPTFVGSSGRVFPRSFKASPLLRAWLRRLDGLGVRVALRHRFEGWDDEGRLRITGPDGPVPVAPDAVLLAMGGASWPRLGSDGAWTGALGKAGVPVSPLKPANVGVVIAWSENVRSRFAGTPLKRVAFSFEGRRVRGEALITATGLEGGAVYALSAALRDAVGRDGFADLTVDLRPDLDQVALARRLDAPRDKRSLSNHLRKRAGLAPEAIGLLRHRASDLGSLDAPALASRIKAAPLSVTGIAPMARAISSAGGIAFAGLDENLMLWAKPGVFVAGEMLDWEAPTGGYLLQGAFATGLAAANGILAWLDRPTDRKSEISDAPGKQKPHRGVDLP